jgi:hypothetical protein
MRLILQKITVVLLCASLAACSPGQALNLLTGGGPNVAANVQAGKTNTQTIGTTKVTEQKLVRPQARTVRQSSDTNSVQAEQVQQVVVNEGAPWSLVYALIALCMVFLALPRADQIWSAFREGNQDGRDASRNRLSTN